MKKHITLTALIMGFCLHSFAQLPQGFNYQAVVRDNGGVIIASEPVGYRFDIRQGSPTGTSVYMEEHAVSTDDRGLVNMVIGQGTSTGDFNAIDWSDGPYFLEVGLDENGGNNYVVLGTSELLSVPYAMHAGSAENVDDADADPTNELQTLSISGNTLSISQGNSVELPAGSMPDAESLAKAWVNFPIAGTPNLAFDGYNVTSTSVTGTGIRVVNLAPGLFSAATNPAMVCQIRNDLAPGFCTVVSSTNPSQVTVRTFNASGVLADKEFSLIIFGK